MRDVGGSLGTCQRRCKCWKSFTSPISTLYHQVAVSMSTCLRQQRGHIELITAAVCNYASLACAANCRGCCSAKQHFLVLSSDPQPLPCLSLQSFHAIYSPSRGVDSKTSQCRDNLSSQHYQHGTPPSILCNKSFSKLLFLWDMIKKKASLCSHFLLCG